MTKPRRKGKANFSCSISNSGMIKFYSLNSLLQIEQAAEVLCRHTYLDRV